MPTTFYSFIETFLLIIFLTYSSSLLDEGFFPESCSDWGDCSEGFKPFRRL
jgi:hypothetical protein